MPTSKKLIADKILTTFDNLSGTNFRAARATYLALK